MFPVCPFPEMDFIRVISVRLAEVGKFFCHKTIQVVPDGISIGIIIEESVIFVDLCDSFFGQKPRTAAC